MSLPRLAGNVTMCASLPAANGLPIFRLNPRHSAIAAFNRIRIDRAAVKHARNVEVVLAH